MRDHIDWLTFTMTMQYGHATASASDFAEEYALAIEQTFLTTFGADLVTKAFGGKWEKNEKSRAPYMDAWKLASGNITLFASPTLTHCCVEISGQGCEKLIREGLLDLVLTAVHERVTRIDIASDIATDTRPTDFVSETSHKRMTASGYQSSTSGETCYGGSQKSDRYARVYRYNPPHPRAHLLRIECVFRRDYAKQVAKQCLASGIDAVARASGEAFGWSHPVWEAGDGDNVDISIVAAERNSGKSVYWLVHTVAPSFRRLCESGVITNPEEFITRYFLSPDKYA